MPPPRTGLLPVKSTSLKPREHESSAIDSIDYDIENEQLTIVFHQRGSYVYFDFPPDEFANFNFAASRGTYFNLYIRDQGYEFERVA